MKKFIIVNIASVFIFISSGAIAMEATKKIDPKVIDLVKNLKEERESPNLDPEDYKKELKELIKDYEFYTENKDSITSEVEIFWKHLNRLINSEAEAKTIDFKPLLNILKFKMSAGNLAEIACKYNNIELANTLGKIFGFLSSCPDLIGTIIFPTKETLN